MVSAPSSFLSQAIWMSIGYSLGAAVGAACATSTRPVIFVGDAGFREGPQVLSTLVQYKLPAVVCVMSNAFLGIQQFLTGPGFYTDQQSPDYFNVIPRWDYAALAKAFGTKFSKSDVVDGVGRGHSRSRLKQLASEPYSLKSFLVGEGSPSCVADALPRAGCHLMFGEISSTLFCLARHVIRGDRQRCASSCSTDIQEERK